ncbi:MAG: hypothetical protein AAFR61_17535 [Bacteroidota bacterium]
MKSSWIWILLALGLWVACGENQAEKEGEDQPDMEEEFLPDSVDTSGMVEAKCLTQPGQICQTGLSFVQVGTYLAELDFSESGGSEGDAEIVHEGGYDRLVRTLTFPSGQVVIEGNFIDGHLTNDSLIYASLVNRIRIEAAEFKTSDGVAVGSPVKAMLAQEVDSAWSIISFAQFDLPQYEMLQIQRKELPQLSFLVDDPNNQIGLAAGEAFIQPKDLPEAARISAIVIAL